MTRETAQAVADASDQVIGWLAILVGIGAFFWLLAEWRRWK